MYHSRNNIGGKQQPRGNPSLSLNQTAVSQLSTKGVMEENQEEKSQKGGMTESQVVHYMLCCNTGICAPTDLVLSPLQQLRSSWTQYPACVIRYLVDLSGRTSHLQQPNLIEKGYRHRFVFCHKNIFILLIQSDLCNISHHQPVLLLALLDFSKFSLRYIGFSLAF